jgi:hypothetical protein
MTLPSTKLWALLLLLLSSGCAMAPVRQARDATSALIADHDFATVARASPEWVSKALHTITALESELAAK